jgi:NAD(P)-dependent dehydrogenase (short-subunit alcohol dehydrogenase family)
LGPLFALEEPLTRQIVIETEASAFSIKEVSMNLTKQVILITGGSRGLGRAFAQALVAAGARVAITARSAPELNETAAQLSATADQAIAIPVDVVDPEAAPRVVAETEQRLGPITLLINNAGQFRAFGRIGDLDPLEWWNEVEANLKGPLLYAHAVLPGMRARRQGRIINVASDAGLQALPLVSAYSVSKTALIRLSESLALETAEEGIKVFAIHPGTVRTPMNDYVHDSPEIGKRVPWLQQRFRTLFAEGRDMPIERSVHLVLRLAAGGADALSGRYITVEDDLDALIKQFAAGAPADQRLLRVNGIAVWSVG